MSAVYLIVAGAATWATYEVVRAQTIPVPGGKTLQQLSDQELLRYNDEFDHRGLMAALTAVAVLAGVYVGVWVVALTVRWVVRGYRTAD